jgi:hypothetical protein
MLLVRTYYQFKPLVPSGIRLAFRRWRAKRRKAAFAARWPINPAAADAPAHWRGWPDGEKFAFVLTHDVEGVRGLEQCRALAELELSYGVRSCFNFVPEGDYQVPADLRDFLSSNGFEVGVHDLKHDGKLYWSRDGFRRNAQSINQYLKEWGAVGFRSGFMHHNLDWIHDLQIRYDSSTFDTDPFEPQPDGVDTIFPFWVPRSSSALNVQPSTASEGYVELPYTLPQDFTLFLLLQEKGIDIWKTKLDWIAAHGGMAMVDVHPDYLDLKGGGIPDTSYSIARYRELLEYVQRAYAGKYWAALPRQVAEHVVAQASPKITLPVPISV